MTKLATSIIENVGGIKNIQKLENCMTRVRIVLYDDNLLNKDILKSSEGVLGYVKQGDQHQIIVGPGVSSTIKQEIQEIIDTNNQKQNNTPTTQDRDIKSEVKAKYEVSFAGGLKKISNIFIPLIPAFIACGLLTGIVNILTNPDIVGNVFNNYPNLIGAIKIFGSSIFSVMMIFVGITTAQVAGGSIAIGAALAGIITHPGLATLHIFGEKLTPGLGGIIAVMMVVYLASFLEKSLKKYLKGSADLILNPLLTISIMGTLSLVVLQPLAGFISQIIGNASSSAINTGGVFTGFILAGAFLPLVMTGLHQALMPIHLQLIHDTGLTPLFSILAMAGAGQVGAAFAVLLKTKNERLKKITKSALPVGILGIGEPLIYGVTLPLGRPFITACIGGACGGAVIGFFKVGALSVGISGLPLALSVGQGMILHYILGILTAYVASFVITYAVGFKDPEN